MKCLYLFAFSGSSIFASPKNRLEDISWLSSKEPESLDNEVRHESLLLSYSKFSWSAPHLMSPAETFER